MSLKTKSQQKNPENKHTFGDTVDRQIFIAWMMAES
jgi:hypothetical protein